MRLCLQCCLPVVAAVAKAVCGKSFYLLGSQHVRQLLFVGFVLLNALFKAKAGEYVEEPGIKGQPHENTLKEYLRTPGLRNIDGTHKPAFESLKQKAKKRGW